MRRAFPQGARALSGLRQEPGRPIGPCASTASHRGLVERVGGQPHVGGVDQPAVAPDGPDPSGLRLPVGGDRRPGVGHLLGRGREDLVGDRHLARMDGPLAVEAERARRRGRPPVAVGVGVVRVRRVDRVDQRRPRRGEHLGAGEVPEVARVLDDRVEVAVDPGVERRREVARPEDQRLEPVARLRDLERPGQTLGVLDQHLEADALREPELGLELAEQHVHPPDVAGRCAPWGR